MPSSAQWLARGVCPAGHALYGPLDLRARRNGTIGCARCEDELRHERARGDGLLAELLAERYGRAQQQRRWWTR